MSMERVRRVSCCSPVTFPVHTGEVQREARAVNRVDHRGNWRWASRRTPLMPAMLSVRGVNFVRISSPRMSAVAHPLWDSLATRFCWKMPMFAFDKVLLGASPRLELARVSSHR